MGLDELSLLIPLVPISPFIQFVRRCYATPAERVLRKDSRPPILLLGSFQDDNARLFNTFWWNLIGVIARERHRDPSYEANVEEVLSSYGPVVAIGRPGEFTVPRGAARFYVEDKRWQDEVRTRIREARLVVVVLGASSGLMWEVRTLLETGLHAKILIAIPPRPGIETERRWAELRLSVPDEFLAKFPDRVWGDFQFADFDEDGAFRRLHGGGNTGTDGTDAVSLFREALKSALRVHFGEKDASTSLGMKCLAYALRALIVGGLLAFIIAVAVWLVRLAIWGK